MTEENNTVYNLHILPNFHSNTHFLAQEDMEEIYDERSLNQLTFADFSKKRNTWAPICPNCGGKMSFEFYDKGPPEEKESYGSKLPDWKHPMLSHCYN